MEVNVEVLYPKCAGLDVHKANVVACARITTDSGVSYETRTFGTTTKALLALSEWLAACGCTHVAMEATGVYWKPVWHVLTITFQLVLANAAYIKGIARPKTDVCDARWIADLLAHGLIRGSLVPDQPIQELRDLTRTRKQLVQEQTRHVQRIQKTLEDANIKLDGVLSDILGVSGRAMLRALIDGETNPEKLAALAHPRVKASRGTIVEALRGRFTEHHRFMLKLYLEQVERLEDAVGEVDKEIEAALTPFRTEIRLMKTIPGISAVSAAIILSEIGADMSRFPTSGNLLSWAHLCPRNDQSAGKLQSTRVRKGSRWLKPTLIQVVLGAIRKKPHNYLRAQYYRLKARRGDKKARVAVAASILTAVYFVLRDKVPYRELGPDYFDKSAPAKATQRLLRRLNNLGYDVELRERKAA
jgi:transposase